MSGALPASTTLSAVPWTTSVGTRMSPSRRERVVRRAGARLRVPARRRPAGAPCGRRRSRRRAPPAASGESAFSTNSRSASSRIEVRAFPSARRSAAASARTVGPPAVVEQRTSLRTRSGRGEHELLRDHPAEADPEHVRALDARARPARRARRRRAARSCTGPAALALAEAAVVERHDPEAPREQRRAQAPARAAVAEPLDHEQQRLARCPGRRSARSSHALLRLGEPGLGRPADGAAGTDRLFEPPQPAGPSARREPGDARPAGRRRSG